DASGKDAWKLDVTRSDVELEDRKDREIASYKIKAGRLRIKQGKSKVLGYVQPVSKKKGFRILDPSKKKTRFLLSPEPDGDWRLETKDGRVLLKIKKRESGFKIVSAKGDTRAKVKVRKGKTSLRDAKGKTTLSTRDPIPPLAAACLTLEPLSMPERVGLCLAIIQWGS
ncbi:MAG: hypothetical protein ACE5GW_11010, partial [Planctomycetota bacterium]